MAGFKIENIIKIVKKHEGFRAKPYKDTVGKLTIGYGHNLDDNGLSENICELILLEDLNVSLTDCMSLYPKFTSFSRDAHAALISMAFNLGRPKLSKFVKMNTAINAGDFTAAADHAMDSKWARQLPNRSKELSELLRRNKDVQD